MKTEKTEKTDIRAKLAEINATHKELDTLSSDHWAKIAKLETERRDLVIQIIKEEKLLSDGIFSFKIESYIQRRSCVLEGPVLREMKKLEQLLNSTPEGGWSTITLDLDKGDSYLTINDNDVFISIQDLANVRKVISDWGLKVEFKNLASHKEKLVKDLKVINNLIKKVKKRGKNES